MCTEYMQQTDIMMNPRPRKISLTYMFKKVQSLDGIGQLDFSRVKKAVVKKTHEFTTCNSSTHCLDIRQSNSSGKEFLCTKPLRKQSSTWLSRRPVGIFSQKLRGFLGKAIWRLIGFLHWMQNFSFVFDLISRGHPSKGQNLMREDCLLGCQGREAWGFGVFDCSQDGVDSSSATSLNVSDLASDGFSFKCEDNKFIKTL